MQAEPVAGELGRQRVGQEGHVVGHDLHDGVRGGEPVLVEGGGEHRDLRLARRPVTREAQVRERRTEEIGHGAGDEVLGRDPLVVPLHEREEEPDLLRRHPLQRVLAEVLDDSRSIVRRHRVHGSLLPALPEGSPSREPRGESRGRCARLRHLPAYPIAASYSAGMAADEPGPGVTNLEVNACWALLRSHEVGRLAVSIADRPEIFPVNYVVDHGTVVFRTAEGTKLAGAVQRDVAFEADGYEPETGEAWSVVVKGRAEEISRGQELLDTADLPLFPWHAAPKQRFVRIVARRDHRPSVSRRRPRSLEDTVDGGAQVGTRMIPGIPTRRSLRSKVEQRCGSGWRARRHRAGRPEAHAPPRRMRGVCSPHGRGSPAP